MHKLIYTAGSLYVVYWIFSSWLSYFKYLWISIPKYLARVITGKHKIHRLILARDINGISKFHKPLIFSKS